MGDRSARTCQDRGPRTLIRASRRPQPRTPLPRRAARARGAAPADPEPRRRPLHSPHVGARPRRAAHPARAACRPPGRRRAVGGAGNVYNPAAGKPEARPAPGATAWDPGDTGRGRDAAVAPSAGTGWTPGPALGPRARPPPAPGETYGWAGRLGLGAGVPRATCRGAGGRLRPSSRILSPLPAPEGARDRAASPPQPRHPFAGPTSPTPIPDIPAGLPITGLLPPGPTP